MHMHKGFGTLLMEEAERIALEEHGSEKISVISGVGTRHYYRKLGYGESSLFPHSHGVFADLLCWMCPAGRIGWALHVQDAAWGQELLEALWVSHVHIRKATFCLASPFYVAVGLPLNNLARCARYDRFFCTLCNRQAFLVRQLSTRSMCHAA